ncbi:MASE1 domain-containing protein [Limnoglobus roseus]|uniref:histidine kinase n=1 Tax=Limnoglobus roseus TaxID=2598579 RepID=A0A5C1ADE3_9BACT|nr:MASE1 domain-containing protein [Limnoglobus roseus]QEL16177.1 PAS domain S-box protein [Limnoglobus roseus]
MPKPSSHRPRPTRGSQSGFDWSSRVLLFAAAYYLTAQIGLLIPSISMVSLFWPPVGISVALLFRYGLRHWPGVLLGAFATNYNVGGPVPSLGFAIGTTLACAVMVRLYQRYHLNPAFESVRDLVVLVAGAVVGTCLSAACGAAWSAANRLFPWADAGHAFVVWWLGDAGGVILGAPIVMAWSYAKMARLRRHGHLRGILGSFGFNVLVCVVLYGGVIPEGMWSIPASFLPFLFIAWAATSYRAWTAMAHVLVLATFVIWAIYRAQGPCIYVADPSLRLYSSWAYLVTAALIAIGLSGLLAERDRVEHKLKTGEATYRALVHDNPALICRFNTDGILLFANETFRHTFTLPAIGESAKLTRSDARKPLIEHNYFQIVGLAQDLYTLAQLRDIKQTDKPVLFESKAVAADNQVHWFRWTARAVDMASSVVSEYHAVGLDVTDQKLAEARQKTLEAQAVQTQQYEAIGVLAGGIAHEFNNILTGIVGNTDLALMLVPSAHTARTMLTDVMAGAQRAAELTKQLSLFAGRTTNHPGPVNVSDLVRSAEGFMGVVVPRRCPLKFELAPEGAIAFADEAKLRQMLMTLVTNAAEAMADEEKRGEIVLRTAVFSIGESSPARQWVNGDALSAGEYVQLEVSDTGSGMTTSTLTRIFEPFFTTKFPGRGLGMAAVLGIVQDHRGAIQVQSQKGRGTTVRVLLPTAHATVDRQTPAPIPRSGRRNVRLSEVLGMPQPRPV